MIELGRHIEILLLNSDCVIIPNFGGFMAHYVEARKDERDSAFLPPMRTIGFNPKLTLNDSLLAQSYVEVYDMSYPDALARIEDEVRELKQHLNNEGQYEMSSIGTLKFKSNGSFEFEPCRAGLLTPSLYGLSYYEFKTLAQLDTESASQTQDEQHVEPKVVVHPATQDIQQQTIDEVEEDVEETGKTTTLWRNIAVACIAFIIFLLIPAPLANNHAHVTQSKINTNLLEYIMPKEVTMGTARVENAVRNTKKVSPDSSLSKEKAVAQEEKKSGFTIVLASRVSKKNASAYVNSLHQKGIADAEVYTNNKHTKVVYGHYTTQADAYNDLNKLHGRQEFADAWVMKY